MKPHLLAFRAILSLLPTLLGAGERRAADTLLASPPALVEGTHGRFDFIKVDESKKRLLACHTENGTLDVIDESTSRLLESIPTGAAQGVAIDERRGLYYVSASRPPRLVIVDATGLNVVGTVDLPAPADVLAYNFRTGRVDVCNDERPEIWTIDPVAKKIVATLTLPGAGLEDLGFDEAATSLFQALKDSDLVARIDGATGKVVATWPTAPAQKPHGLAVVPSTGRLLVAGGNGKVVLMNTETGQVTASADIAPRVDEIAYDSVLHRAYAASGTGVISVVAVEQDKLTSLAALPTSPGAHSVAVDSAAHTVWTVFAKDGKAYVQAFRTP